jgi:WD40 repeat protein
MEAVELTPIVMQSIDVAKVFKTTEEISSISFSNDGQYLLASNGAINFYNVLKGTDEKVIKSYSTIIHFTNHPSGFLSGSKQSLEYWNLNKTNIIHSYPMTGITSLDMSPRNDLFIASASKLFQIYDLNTKKCIGELDITESIGNIICKYDCYGLIFAIAYPVISDGKYKNIIQLFDAKEFSRGAFMMWSIDGAEVISIDFSFDGQHLVLNTKTSQVFVLDALDGKVKHVFKEYNGNSYCPVVLSPDSKYFFVGCENNFGVVAVNAENCQKVHEIKGNLKSIRSVAWSPEHCVMATGNDHLMLWVPDYMRLR